MLLFLLHLEQILFTLRCVTSYNVKQIKIKSNDIEAAQERNDTNSITKTEGDETKHSLHLSLQSKGEDADQV